MAVMASMFTTVFHFEDKLPNVLDLRFLRMADSGELLRQGSVVGNQTGLWAQGQRCSWCRSIRSANQCGQASNKALTRVINLIFKEGQQLC